MEQVLSTVSKWYGKAEVKNTAVFWTASLLVSFINYLYYPVLGRLMTPADFGETQTVISIFTQAAVFFQVLSLVSIGIITRYSDEETRVRINNELSRLALILSLSLFVLTVVFSGLLAGFFKFTGTAPFLALAAAILVTVPLSFANSYLQGHKRFWTLSAGNLLAAIIKIVAAVIFVLAGYGALGAIGGLVAAQLLALIYSLRMGTGVRRFVNTHVRPGLPHFSVVSRELPFAGMVLITSLTTNLMLSFDILVVKHFFPPVQAGLYTGISIISNIIYFATAPIAAVMIPSIKPKLPLADNRRVLSRALLATIAIGGLITLVFLLFPEVVVHLLLGTRFTAYAGYLPGLSLALFGMSISALLIYFHIGLRDFLVAPIVGAGLIFTLFLLATAHATMGAVVIDLVAGAAVLLFMLASLTLGYRRAAA